MFRRKKKSTKSIEELQAENIGKFMEDGPRLRVDYNDWIVARDRARGMVLLGGLGALGVGQLWSKEADYMKSYPGYDDAPEQSSSTQYPNTILTEPMTLNVDVAGQRIQVTATGTYVKVEEDRSSSGE